MLLPLTARVLLAVTLLPGAAAVAQEENPAIPDFTSINLPTTLRLPAHRLAFRVTHRFARPLGDGDFGDLVADLFGFDSGAQVGLELRFGVFSSTQFGVYRTSDRTIQLFLQQDLMQQGTRPIGLAAYGTFEGLDNLQEEYSPGFALVASRTFGERAAIHVIPGWVGNTNLLDEEGDDDNSFIVGLAGRLRLGEVYSLMGEVVPRIGGYQHQDTQVNFAIERRTGGHNFQINFGNGHGSTLAQVARGGVGGEEGTQWYIGFNLSRKFF